MLRFAAIIYCTVSDLLGDLCPDDHSTFTIKESEGGVPKSAQSVLD